METVPLRVEVPATVRVEFSVVALETVKLSVILTVPPVEFRIRFPVTVSIVLLLTSFAILISPMCASANGKDELPIYAPSSVSGTIPVLTVSNPPKVEVPVTVKLGVTLTVPPIASKTRFPVAVSIVLSVVSAILISPM